MYASQFVLMTKVEENKSTQPKSSTVTRRRKNTVKTAKIILEPTGESVCVKISLRLKPRLLRLIAHSVKRKHTKSRTKSSKNESQLSRPDMLYI